MVSMEMREHHNESFNMVPYQPHSVDIF